MKRQEPMVRKNVKRLARRWTAAYHSVRRMLWVQSLPCAVCGDVPSDNAHIGGGGMGIKGPYQSIVPLCGNRVEAEGCHNELHRVGLASFEAKYHLVLSSVAVNVQAQWEAMNGTP